MDTFEKIYAETYKGVYFTCYAFLKNEKDAEDIAQEVYLAFLTSAGIMEAETEIKAWLATVAANKCRNLLKKKKPILVEDEVMEDLKVETNELLLPEEYVTNKAKRQIVVDIMKEKLSEVQYQTVVLFYFNNLSVQEIADIMECPTGTVTYRLSVARERIKAGVEKYEKKSGDKLYSIALVPALSLLFAQEANAMEPVNMCAKIIAASRKSGMVAARAAEQGGKAMLNSFKVKLVLCGLSLVVVIGGIAAVVAVINNSANQESGKGTENVQNKDDEDLDDGLLGDDAEDEEKKPEMSWDAEANADYFVWDGTVIKGWTELGMEQNAVIIPAECEGMSNNALGWQTNLEYVSFESEISPLYWGTFRDCTSLKEVHLPSKIETIPHHLFNGCIAMEEIDIPDSVVQIDSFVFANTGIKRITMPEGVTEISNGLFENCTNLTEVNFSGNETVIGAKAFSNCTALESITIPSSVTTIGEDAFSGCKALKEIKIPEGVVTIENSAFSDCDNLTAIYLPASLENIGRHVFSRGYDDTDEFEAEIKWPICIYVKEGSPADSIDFEELADNRPVTKLYY